jgi:hypothetical protein
MSQTLKVPTARMSETFYSRKLIQNNLEVSNGNASRMHLLIRELIIKCRLAISCRDPEDRDRINRSAVKNRDRRRVSESPSLSAVVGHPLKKQMRLDILVCTPRHMCYAVRR